MLTVLDAPYITPDSLLYLCNRPLPSSECQLFVLRIKTDWRHAWNKCLEQSCQEQVGRRPCRAAICIGFPLLRSMRDACCDFAELSDEH